MMTKLKSYEIYREDWEGMERITVTITPTNAERLREVLPRGMHVEEIPCAHSWNIVGVLESGIKRHMVLEQCPKCKGTRKKQIGDPQIAEDGLGDFDECEVCGTEYPSMLDYCPNRVPANAGGCWICNHLGDSEMAFSTEFDARYHPDCLPDEHDTLLDYERAGLGEEP